MKFTELFTESSGVYLYNARSRKTNPFDNMEKYIDKSKMVYGPGIYFGDNLEDIKRYGETIFITKNKISKKDFAETDSRIQQNKDLSKNLDSFLFLLYKENPKGMTTLLKRKGIENPKTVSDVSDLGQSFMYSDVLSVWNILLDAVGGVSFWRAYDKSFSTLGLYNKLFGYYAVLKPIPVEILKES